MATRRILALSGSLREASTNTALLGAARLLAPDDLAIVVFDGLGHLPLFNPDLDDGVRPVPQPAMVLRAAVGASDALLVACPEYAHGIPGAFKNALDWLVGGPEFPGKPVALFHATTRGAHIRASLEDTIATMSGRLLPIASLALPLVGQRLTAETIASRHAGPIQAALRTLSQCLIDAEQHRSGLLDPPPSAANSSHSG